MATWTRLGAEEMVENLDRYAELATRIAEIDLDTLAGIADTDTVLERAIVGTVLGDVLLSCLRRVAQAAESGRRLAAGGTMVPAGGAAAGRSSG